MIADRRNLLRKYSIWFTRIGF